MAKISKSMIFKNAIIDENDMTITEITKDSTNVYSLQNLLHEWHGIEGVSLTIKQDNEIPSEETSE